MAHTLHNDLWSMEDAKNGTQKNGKMKHFGMKMDIQSTADAMMVKWFRPEVQYSIITLLSLITHIYQRDTKRISTSRYICDL